MSSSSTASKNLQRTNVRIKPLLVAAIAVASIAAPAAQPQVPFHDQQPFHAGVDLTSITVTVRNADGQLVTDLPLAAFQVLEDGEPQVVTQFTHERIPVSLGLLLDTSDSMYGKRIRDARAAVDQFLFKLLAPDDEFFITAFNHQVHLLTPWTRDPLVVGQALDALKPSGSTAIYDAVVSALPRIDARAHERAAIVILTDGADTASDASMRDVTMALRKSDALVYAIAIDSPDPQPINTRVNAAALAELTSGTGGRVAIVRSSDELTAAAADIALELNSQYLLGYVSTHGADGKYHSIRVRVTGAEYSVRARTGYTAVRRP
jgi:Ca-activated chloride channel family protein